MSLQRNSALSMRTICFSKPVSELVLQTGLTRPRSWTEEVSDLGRGLFSFEFPAQIETSASREVLMWRNKILFQNAIILTENYEADQVASRVFGSNRIIFVNPWICKFVNTA